MATHGIGAILDLANRTPGFDLGDKIEYESPEGAKKTINIEREPSEDLNVARAKVLDRDSGDPWEVPGVGVVTMVVTKHWHAPFPCQGITDPAERARSG